MGTRASIKVFMCVMHVVCVCASVFVSILLCLMACVLCQSKKIYHSMNSNRTNHMSVYVCVSVCMTV